jgi:hypothetical protein
MKKLALVLALVGISIFNNSFSQSTIEYGGLTVQYGSFEFNKKVNDNYSIESEVQRLLLLQFVNAEETTDFKELFDIHVNVEGLPVTSDLKGKESPTEITAILFPKDKMSDAQAARESVRILNKLIAEENLGIKDSEYTGYRVKVKTEGSNIKLVIMVNSAK